MKTQDRDCSYRAGKICPLDGKCMHSNLIYQAIVEETKSNKINTYIGLTSTTFKARLANHHQAFKNKSLQKSYKLAQFIWNLKDKKIEHTISWKLIAKASTYSISSNICNLCVTEKYFILYKPEMATINKRSELVNNCRHKTNQLLDKG